jgi:hypothetical protein
MQKNFLFKKFNVRKKINKNTLKLYDVFFIIPNNQLLYKAKN